MKLHDLMLCQAILQEFSRLLQIKFIFYVTGLIYAFFNCSNYTFHENSTEGRSWETSRLLCQNSSEGDLVSIEEEEERNFVKNIIKNLKAIKYFIGLKKDNGKWKWLRNKTAVNSSQGKSLWAPGQPSGTSKANRKDNCATIYGKYKSYLGRFDDISCSRSEKVAGHICERAVSCTEDERGRSLFAKELFKRPEARILCVFFLVIQLSILWSITKEEDRIPTPSTLPRKPKLPKTRCYKVITIEIVEEKRG